jgi:hypothetical protein
VNAKMTFAGVINALFRPAHPTPPKLGTRPFVGMINDRLRSNSEVSLLARHVRCTLKSGRRQAAPAGPFRVDFVEKLENREAPKISQMQRVGDFCRCKAL